MNAVSPVCEILETQFSEIESIWRSKLWPDRKSLIEPTSAINHLGQIDLQILQATPVFFKAMLENRIVGVVSGLQTEERYFRSRGLWVDPEIRRQRLGTRLVEAIYERAREQSCEIMWTMPRPSSVEFYLKLGFSEYGKAKGFEYGPHQLLQKQISLGD